MNLFFETLPNANNKDKTKPIGREITNKSRVLSKPVITSKKFRKSKESFK
jgi:hypothetical protein